MATLMSELSLRGVRLGVVLIAAAACSQAADVGGANAIAELTARVERLEGSLQTQRVAGGSRHDRDIVHRLELIEARLDALSRGSAPAAEGLTGDPLASPAATIPKRLASEPDPELHPEVSTGIGAGAGSSEHRSALRRLADLLVKAAGPPPAERDFEWAAAMLDRETRRARISAAEAEDIATLMLGLPPGHGARAGLARAVVIGWGDDERLGTFLPRISANAEPDVHRGILSVLDDEHPSTAYSEYVMRLLREERDPAVLARALDLDRVEAAATGAAAKGLARAVEMRILDGGLDSGMRSRAGLAISVACLRSPDTGVEMLRRLAGKKTDAKVSAEYLKAAAALEQGNATLKSLERLFSLK